MISGLDAFGGEFKGGLQWGENILIGQKMVFV